MSGISSDHAAPAGLTKEQILLLINRTHKWTEVANLQPSEKNIFIQVIVLQVLDSPKRIHNGDVIHHFLVADHSGSVECMLFNDVGAAVRPGDVLRLYLAYGKFYVKSLRLYVHKHGLVRKIGDMTMLFSENPCVSKFTWREDPDKKNHWVRADPPPAAQTTPQLLPSHSTSKHTGH